MTENKHLESAISSLNEAISMKSGIDLVAAAQAASATVPLSAAADAAVRAAGIHNDNVELLHAIGTRRDDIRNLTSLVPMPVGLVSADNSAVLGRNGFIFLIGGSNDVLGQYYAAPERVIPMADRWLDLMRARQERAASTSSEYIHIMIPERISVLPEFVPYDITTPTSLLGNIELKTKSDPALARCYISARDIFWRFVDRTPFVKKMDSHLSPFGSYSIFSEVLSRARSFEVQDLRFEQHVSQLGDLTLRTLGFLIPEVFTEVGIEALPEYCSMSRKVDEQKSPEGHFMGGRQVWRNPGAPIKEKVVVFGNSFFSTVENGQSTLSWWFSRWFSEFHFIWSNEVDWDYVGREKPSVLIWQGVERFLPIIPAS